MKVFYRVIDIDDETYFEYTSSACYDFDHDYEKEALLEECANDYWSNHDGWECTWPLTFSLHRTENGSEIARFTIEMEAEPRFYATVIEDATQSS